MDTLGDWLLNDPASPLTAHTPAELDMAAYFDVKVVYQQRFADIDLNRVPEVFRPRAGRLRLVDWEKVYATDEGHDIFSERGDQPRRGDRRGAPRPVRRERAAPVGDRRPRRLLRREPPRRRPEPAMTTELLVGPPVRATPRNGT